MSSDKTVLEFMGLSNSLIIINWVQNSSWANGIKRKSSFLVSKIKSWIVFFIIDIFAHFCTKISCYLNSISSWTFEVYLESLFHKYKHILYSGFCTYQSKSIIYSKITNNLYITKLIPLIFFTRSPVFFFKSNPHSLLLVCFVLLFPF